MECHEGRAGLSVSTPCGPLWAVRTGASSLAPAQPLRWAADVAGPGSWPSWLERLPPVLRPSLPSDAWLASGQLPDPLWAAGLALASLACLWMQEQQRPPACIYHQHPTCFPLVFNQN